MQGLYQLCLGSLIPDKGLLERVGSTDTTLINSLPPFFLTFEYKIAAAPFGWCVCGISGIGDNCTGVLCKGVICTGLRGIDSLLLLLLLPFPLGNGAAGAVSDTGGVDVDELEFRIPAARLDLRAFTCAFAAAAGCFAAEEGAEEAVGAEALLPDPDEPRDPCSGSSIMSMIMESVASNRSRSRCRANFSFDVGAAD